MLSLLVVNQSDHPLNIPVTQVSILSATSPIA
nr:MAG TPA: hypothetical protein [Caudoviricetes sp.]